MTESFAFYEPPTLPPDLLALAREEFPGREVVWMAVRRAGASGGRMLASLLLRSYREWDTQEIPLPGGHTLIACLGPPDTAGVLAAMAVPPLKPAEVMALTPAQARALAAV